MTRHGATKFACECVEGCGAVLQESAIVSEVAFAETGGGGHSLIGQFVSHEGPTKLSIGGLQGYNGRESREVTLNNGKRRIQEVASQLRLNQHCMDMAFNFFKMAVSKGITRGRKSPYVIAACLYMTCRIEGTPHLLLDFSDVLRVNIFDLGKTFSFICRSLYISVPPTDPCVYVLRFANCLAFGEREHDVVMMALKLVSRMKKDWMVIGRRPTGVCGAALLLAARAHNFNRTIADIVKVVSIGESVLRKRLAEFSATPSSALTLEEFASVDLEEEADPPCFTEGKAKARAKQDRDAWDRAAAVPDSDFISELEAVDAAISHKISKRRGKVAAPGPVPQLGFPNVQQNEEELNQAAEFLSEEVLEIAAPEMTDTAKKLFRKAKELRTSTTMDNDKPEEQEPPPVAENESGDLDLDGIDDDEIDQYIMNEPEVKMKTFIWMRSNGDFMREKEEKMRLKEELEEKLRNDPNAKKKKTRSRKKQPIQGKTAAEAMEKVIHEKKLSNKINYSVLASLAPSTSDVTSDPAPPPSQPTEPSTDEPSPAVVKSPASPRRPPAAVTAPAVSAPSRGKRKAVKPKLPQPKKKAIA